MKVLVLGLKMGEDLCCRIYIPQNKRSGKSLSDLIDIWDCVENLSELSKALVKDVRIEIKIEVC